MADVSYIVRGARMKCSKGSVEKKINLPVSHGAYVNEKPMMNKSDRTVIKNITSFGQCTTGKCCPLIFGDWIFCKEDMLVEGKGALTTDSILVCAKGGQIKFIDDGQK
ncbi:MAG: DUF4280 domain-containing protein [Clostridiaceae bacterium]